MHNAGRTGNALLSAEPPGDPRRALARDGKVVAALLVEELGVSEDTVRRDLRELAAQGLVQRVHGGALAPAPQAMSGARREMFADAKPAPAQAALELLAPARVILLDGSTTNFELARRPPPSRDCTILTNSLPIAAALAEHPSAEVVMIGGRLDKRSQVTVGAATVDFLRHTVHADACVLGVCALHPDTGLSTDDPEEAVNKRAMVDASADVIALATADKLRAGSAYLVAPVAELTHVADAAAPDELLDPYRAIGVTVTRA